MGEQVRMTWTVLRVLRALFEHPTTKHYGFEICRATGLPSGTVYPVLMRLEHAGWLDSAWEDVDPKKAKRPRRRFYRLTGEGVRYAQVVLQDAQRTLGLRWDQPSGLPSPGGASA